MSGIAKGRPECRNVGRSASLLLPEFPLAAFSLVAILMIASGCQTWQKHHVAAVQQFSAGNLNQSRESLQKSLESVRAEQNVVKLDTVIVDLASGRTLEAENQLRTVRRELDELSQKDLAEQTASVLTDDRAIAYSGRQFEQQMALNVLLLSSLLSNGQDAFAYAQQVRQSGQERHQILAKAFSEKSNAEPASAVIPAGFEPSTSTQADSRANVVAAEILDQTYALGAYLSAAVQSESSMRHQETEAALREIEFWNPQFAQLRRESNPASEFGTRCRPGHGTLHVIAFVGRAPEWIPESSMPSSASLLIADRILSATGKHTLPPTLSAVKIARPEPFHDYMPAGTLRCVLSGESPDNAAVSQSNLTFHSLVDLNAVAMSDYHANRDLELARAVTRRVLKKGAVYVLKETQKIHRNTAVDLVTNVAGVAWEAMEKPDTRSWKLLPARVDVAMSELPAGVWQTNLNCGNGSSAVIPVHIEDGRNTFVVCFIPQRSLTGHVLVGGADKGAFPVSPARGG